MGRGIRWPFPTSCSPGWTCLAACSAKIGVKRGMCRCSLYREMKCSDDACKGPSITCNSIRSRAHIMPDRRQATATAIRFGCARGVCWRIIPKNRWPVLYRVPLALRAELRPHLRDFRAVEQSWRDGQSARSQGLLRRPMKPPPMFSATSCPCRPKPGPVTATWRRPTGRQAGASF